MTFSPSLLVAGWIVAAAGLLPAAAADCAASRKGVAIVGSSTAQGVGASAYGRSWAGLLTQALAGRGLTVDNFSVSGFSSRDALARFQQDVRPRAPGIVLLGTSIFNEPTSAPLEQLIPQYLRYTRELIRKVEEIGATPIVIGPYPSSRCDPAARGQIGQLYRELEAEGVLLLDFFSSVSDAGCQWNAGLSVDGLHPTDAGHLQLFESIPLSFFDGWPCSQSSPANPMSAGSWEIAPENTGSAYIRVRPVSAMPSWSVSLWLRPGSSDSERVLVSAGDGWVELRRRGSRLELRSPSRLLAVRSLAENSGFVHVGMSYSKGSASFRAFLNHEAWADVRIPPPLRSEIVIGGHYADESLNATGDAFSRVILYRTRLSAELMGDLSDGDPPWRSVEAFLPLAHSPSRRALNSAWTTVEITVQGEWRLLADHPTWPTFVRTRSRRGSSPNP